MKTASKARGGYAGGATANLLPRHRLRPWRMAATVPTLLAGVPAWQVVQRFNRGLLLSACGDGLRGGSVLFIGTDETSSGPFHLQLAAPQFAQLRLANVLSLTSGGSGLLVVNGGGNGGGDSDGGSLVASGGGGDGGSLVASDVSIETSGVPCYNVEAPALMPHAIPFALRELSAFLACNAQPTGLGLAPFALLAPDGPLPCAPEELAQELRQTGQSPQQAFQRLTSYLVGRGLGLTPSGDDLLVGMM
ncbi:MAG: DUF2877 domain-containing protein, partial [Coriobacteriales bacterium]|nr:DUF2877 domain-containing protein [Coriobacteriales bacterium]